MDEKDLKLLDKLLYDRGYFIFEFEENKGEAQRKFYMFYLSIILSSIFL